MPKLMPDLVGGFNSSTSSALAIIAAGEQARVALAGRANQPITVHRLELLYELAYLRVFLAWETFLEESFLRYMCGYHNSIGPDPLPPTGNYYSSIGAANLAVLNGQNYKLWHNPNHVVARANGFVPNGHHQTVISSALVDLTYYAAIRHRIAHSQRHARTEFDAATVALCGVRYKGSRPGRFLRDWRTIGGVPIERWHTKIFTDLSNLAVQIVP